MLVSPLTERPYFLFLLIPLIGLFCWVREVGVAGLFERRATVVAVLFWLLLAGPAEVAEYVFDTGVTVQSHAAPLFTLLAPVYMWVTAAAFVFQLLVVAHIRGLRVVPAVAVLCAAPRGSCWHGSGMWDRRSASCGRAAHPRRRGEWLRALRQPRHQRVPLLPRWPQLLDRELGQGS